VTLESRHFRRNTVHMKLFGVWPVALQSFTVGPISINAGVRC